MIRFPTTLAEVREAPGRIRAGGTDEMDLHRRGITDAPVRELRDVEGLGSIIVEADGSLAIGARVTLAQLAAEPVVRKGWPALASAAGEVATPPIRRRATLAGSLLQQVHCAYFRSVAFDCLKKGGATCFAREGDHELLSVFDQSACIAPHPSTMAGVLWAFDAQIEVYAGGAPERRSVPALLGDGTDPRRTHHLADDEVVTGVLVPPASLRDRSAYVRVSLRARAEWPLVEATTRLQVDADGRLGPVVLVAGGVAPRPLRFDEVAAALTGRDPTDPAVDDLLATLDQPSPALPQAAYKGRLLARTLRQAIDRALVAKPGLPENE